MDIHRDSYSAWCHLVECGGLELGGRDDGFEADLLESLCTNVPDLRSEPAGSGSLEDALRRTPLPKFLRAFFGVTQPYLRMFEAILRYFEAAGAKEGRQHWCLALETDEHLDLDSFKTQLARWNSVRGTVRVPALDLAGAWRIREVFIRHGACATEGLQDPCEELILPEWLKAWLLSYKSANPLPLPQATLQAELPGPFHAVIPFLCAIAHRRMELGLSLEAALAELRKRGFNYPAHDALDRWTVAGMESDYYLRERLKDLYAARSLPQDVHAAIGQGLQQLLSEFPTRWLDMDVSLSDMEDLLRLPIWQKRSELYAVWVATEIVSGLSAHQVCLHHDNGRLEFAFRETLLASVLTARPLIALYGERRSPLSPAAQSTARTEGVQPDYGLWRAAASGAESCILAVECKHHKHSAGRKFSEVLSDYAHSLPNAQIYLVSHGPIGEVCAGLPFSVRARCFTIPHLRADEQSGVRRAQLREAVREAVGAAVVPTIGQCLLLGQRDCIVVVDVSLSMHPILQEACTLDKLLTLTTALHANVVATVDTSIVTFVRPTRWDIQSAIQHRGVGTSLAAPVRTLQALFKRTVILTDEDGIGTLSGQEMHPVPSWDSRLKIVEVKDAGN